MKTTFSMILERACSLLSVKPVFESAPLDQPVSSISLWQPNTALSEETLYISAYMPLPHERPRQIIVLSGEGVREDIEQYNIHPTWVLDHIRDLYHSLEE